MSQASRSTSLPISSGNLHQRDSFDRTDRRESVAFDPQFLQWLRCLPDELERLECFLKREMISPPRFDTSSERSDHHWKKQQQEMEQNLKREYDKRYKELETRYEERLRDTRECLERQNNDLQKRLQNCETLVLQKEEEMKTLKRRLEEAQERASVNANQVMGTERHRNNHPQELWEMKQMLEDKEKELQRLKERHAAISERRVRSDQRKTEDTLSSNRLSELETEYVTDLKDGARVDAVEVITNTISRSWAEKPSPSDYLKNCRLACFIFETAYECAETVKKAFVNSSCATLQTFAMDAPSIGLETNLLYNKVWQGKYTCPAEASNECEGAISEVMILVKDQAKRHDVTQLVQEVKRAIISKWTQQLGFLPRYDRMVLYYLDKYINYCTKFAWCMVCQVPPLKIEHSDTVYSSISHSRSSAFSFSDDYNPSRCPTYPETQESVMCYLWPTLQDSDGRVLVKGEVVLK